MKMITAIVNKKDAGSVCDALTKAGYFFTKMATTGGFLKAGNTTLLIGTDNDKVTAAVEIIRKNCATSPPKFWWAERPYSSPTSNITKKCNG